MRDRVILSSLLGSLLAGGIWSTPALAESAASYRELGIRYRNEGLMSEAIDALQQAMALEPNNLDGRVTLGWTLHLAKDDRAAAQILQETLTIDPFYVPALNALGIVYLVNNDLAGAILTHRWATLLAPDNEIAHYNLSLAFERSQQYDWAIDDAKTAAQLEPDNPHPLVALAIAHWGKGETDLATQSYQQAIGIDPRYAESSFLDYLNEAGFSSRQIETSKQVLSALP